MNNRKHRSIKPLDVLYQLFTRVLLWVESVSTMKKKRAIGENSSSFSFKVVDFISDLIIKPYPF